MAYPNFIAQACSGSTRKTTRSLRTGYGIPRYLFDIWSMIRQAESPSIRSTTRPRICAMLCGLARSVIEIAIRGSRVRFRAYASSAT